jgi:hypothetical protein
MLDQENAQEKQAIANEGQSMNPFWSILIAAIAIIIGLILYVYGPYSPPDSMQQELDFEAEQFPINGGKGVDALSQEKNPPDRIQ